MNQLEVGENRDDQPRKTPQNPEQEALRRIELFRRETKEEVETAMDKGTQRVQVAQSISPETSILHRKLATVVDSAYSRDIDIWRLLKALHKRHLCLNIKEIFEDESGVNDVIDKTNAYLERLGLKIHSRNGFLLLGPANLEKANIEIVNNPETRKTMHYTGPKISAQKTAKVTKEPGNTTAAAAKAPESAESQKPGPYATCVEQNKSKFLSEKNKDTIYIIAMAIARNTDTFHSRPSGKEGINIIELARKTGIKDYAIAYRLRTVKNKFQQIGIIMEMEETEDDASEEDIREAEGMAKYLWPISIIWTKESKGNHEIHDEIEEDELDDYDKQPKRPESRASIENSDIQKDPGDIFPAFRNKTIVAAGEFNALIGETITGLHTDFMEISKRDARKLLRSVNALHIDPSLQARVNKWKTKLIDGIKRKKDESIGPKKASNLLRGIEVDKK